MRTTPRRDRTFETVIATAFFAALAIGAGLAWSIAASWPT